MRRRGLAARAAICGLVMLAGLAVAVAAGPDAALAQTASQTAAGCKGVTPAVIPAQGVISNPGQTEGGHFWWQNTNGGTCVGTVIEDVELTAAAPTRTLRVIVFDTADPGGLTVARMQATGSPGPQSLAFGIHQVFAGLTSLCLAATSPVVPSPDLPCFQFGTPPPAQQFTQGPGSTQPGGQLQPWAPWVPWQQVPAHW
jgi:hypothetical protein